MRYSHLAVSPWHFGRTILIAAVLLAGILPGPAAAASDAGSLHFTAAGHALRFSPEGVVMASGGHALKIEFVNGRAVLPESDTPTTATGAASPLTHVRYSDLWEGITLEYEQPPDGGVKTTYTLAPGTPVDRIRLRYNAPIHVAAQGELTAVFPSGLMRESRPVAWQEVNGIRRPVEVSFRTLGDRDAGFSVGAHDPALPLVIDPVLQWNTFAGGVSPDTSYALAMDASGNSYIAGYSSTSWGGNIKRPFAGSQDAFVAKFDANGVYQWNTFLGGSTTNDDAMDIALDDAGNVYVVGNSAGTWGAPSRLFAGARDTFLVKLNTDGTLNWHIFLGSLSSDDARGLVVDGTGNSYVVGTSGGIFGGISPIRGFQGAPDAFVAKVDTSGTLLWHTFLGSPSIDGGGDITLDSLGNIYMVGYSDATWGGPLSGFTGGQDAFVAKLDGTGNLLWHTFMGSATFDTGNTIAVAGSLVYVAGTSNATWGITPKRPYSGSTDVFVAQLDVNGSLTWNTFLGSTLSDEGVRMAANAGGAYITGSGADTWGDPVIPHAGNADTLIARVDDTGNLLWHAFLGSSGNEYGEDIAVDGTGNIYVTGLGDASWGTPIVSPPGLNDAFLAKLRVPEVAISSPGLMDLIALPGVTDHPIHRIELAVDVEDVILDGIAMTTGGTYSTADIAAFNLWYSTDAVFDAATDTLLGSRTSVPSFSVMGFSSLGHPIAAGTTGHLFVTVDVSPSAPGGRTVFIDSLNFSNIQIPEAAKFGGDPLPRGAMHIVGMTAPGTALQFDGIDDHVNISTISDDMAGKQAAFTASLWFKSTASVTGTAQAGLLTANSSSGLGAFALVIGGCTGCDNAVSVYDGATGTYAITGPPLSIGFWHHVAYTRSGTTGTLYLDGELVGTHTAGFAFDASQIWYLGQKPVASTFPIPSNFFTGELDETLIWTRTRTEAEIRQDMHRSIALSLPDLAGYYRFDQTGSGTLLDFSGNDNVGVLNGMTPFPSWVASRAVLDNPSSVHAETVRAWAIWNGHGTMNAGGLVIQNSSFLQSAQFDYLLAGHDNQPLTFTTADVVSPVTSRWQRLWYLDLHDDVGDGGFMTITFDLGSTAAGSYDLLYRGDATGNFSTVLTSAILSGTLVVFTVDAANLADGYYTLGVPNTPPTSADGSVTLDQDTVYAFAATDFAYADIDGQVLASIRITGLPTFGTLFVDANGNGSPDTGETVVVGQDILATNIPKLSFQSLAGENGNPYTQFLFRVNDGIDVSVSDNSMSVIVTPVNSAPIVSGLNGNAVTFTGTPVSLTQGKTVSVTDVDTLYFNGGWVSVDQSTGKTGDQVTLDNNADGDNDPATGIFLDASGMVSRNGAHIGLVDTLYNGTNGLPLKIYLTGTDVLPSSVQAILQALTFYNPSTADISPRTLEVTVNDGMSVSTPSVVTVNFPSSITLTVSISGAGSVTGRAISCPSTCTATYNPGQVESLTAVAGTGYVFSGWSITMGMNTGESFTMSDNPLSVVMDGPKTVMALFSFNNGGSTGGDPYDLCPGDPYKNSPGLCGCGVSDIDTDGDGVPDCEDLCPDDPDKIDPGVCGCGRDDVDKNGDGIPDCVDLCPDDPEKTVPGRCGCGIPETDTDGDGTPDCVDLCPDDPNKIVPGGCGCGVPDVDANKDGVLDCVDFCPDDPNKTEPGECGCGVPDIDLDGDGLPNCVDSCPNDPDKIEPGLCGCGVPDTDMDRDGTPDCQDGCPLDANKTEPGTCGCGLSDGDADGDGQPDCRDLCPNDPLKSEPGACGCGTSEADDDGDGIPNCQDGCPGDPTGSAPGPCGCGIPVTDANGDGIPDCQNGDAAPPAESSLLSPKDGAFFVSGPVWLEARLFSGVSLSRPFVVKWYWRHADAPHDEFLFSTAQTIFGGVATLELTDVIPGMRYRAWVEMVHPDTGNVLRSEIREFTVGPFGDLPGPSVAPGDKARNFRMLGIPLWSQGGRMTDLLERAVGAYDPRYFRIGAYSPAAGRYLEYSGALTVAPGMAYWFLAREGLDTPVAGVETTLAVPLHVPLAVNPVKGFGWNMVSPPNRADYFWKDLKILRCDAEGKILFGPTPISELGAGNGLIVPTLWEWSDGAYAGYSAVDPGAVLRSGQGYWVKALQDGVYLVFAPEARTTGASLTWLDKTGYWLKRRLSVSPAVAADADSPPAPPSALTSDDSASRVDGGGGGCFLSTMP